MTTAPGLLQAVADAFEKGGIDLEAWALSWARVAPVILLVPALGLRSLPGAMRAAAALVLGAVIVPALRPAAHGAIPFPVALLAEFARGLPVAVAAAVPLWAATMVGGVIDALRGAQDYVAVPTVEGRATPLGVLFSLLAGMLFLALGGPARVVGALVEPAPMDNALPRAAFDLAAGIGIAVAVAAPLLAAAVVLEITAALVARAASPAQVHTLLAPARSLALLALLAVLFDRIAGLMALLVSGQRLGVH
jgi:type III secretory pathway component EscT